MGPQDVAWLCHLAPHPRPRLPVTGRADVEPTPRLFVHTNHLALFPADATPEAVGEEDPIPRVIHGLAVFGPGQVAALWPSVAVPPHPLAADDLRLYVPARATHLVPPS